MVEPICDLPPLSESLRDSESHLNVHSRGHAGTHGGVGVLYSCALQQMGVGINVFGNYWPIFGAWIIF